MSGVDVIGALLRGNDAVTAAVPAGDIIGGALGEEAPLPSILVRSVSLADRQQLRPGATRRSVERVAGTVRAASYRQQRLLIGLVRAACADRGGIFGALRNVSVLTAGTGPDVDGPSGSFERTQDFRVSFDSPAE